MKEYKENFFPNLSGIPKWYTFQTVQTINKKNMLMLHKFFFDFIILLLDFLFTILFFLLLFI